MSDSDSSQRNYPRQDRERDLILGPGEYANILDETKGHVTVYVGPSKASLSQTDRPVQFEPKSRKFVQCSLEDSIFTFAFAEKGSYIVLHNPVNSPKSSTSEESRPSKAHPVQGPNQLPDLAYGSKINIEGPETFALFPGQYSDTIYGHRMRSNQYLIVRVYDEEAAKENWSKATIKLQKKEGDETPDEPTDKEKVEAIGTPDLTMGRLLVIEGTKVSFYIPPTGIEVVKDRSGSSEGYVRNAVTLERLEYCILLDEDGNKRYVQGPDVVFPAPTETFVEKNDSRKFRAIELNELMGLYVKVIADYTEGEEEFKTGDELFITGKDQKIYYPRPEHAIVKYGNQMVSYAIAIPAGEARYVLNRDTGEIRKKAGPAMFLPDPRHEVIVRRVLSDKEVNLWFPGNAEAAVYNNELVNLAQDIQEDMMDVSSTYVPDRTVRTRSARSPRKQALMASAAAESYDSVGLAASEEMKRKDRFTPPRTITIDTKYEGAVTIDVWPGYAVQVVSKTGERKVIVGPEVYLLEYDETLEKMSFSSGTPKSDDKLKNDVYLRVLHNTISDLISVETRDLCPIDVVVSYRVNFEGTPKNWFNVENYVKFLTDHLRSVLRNKVKQLGIEEFYGNSIDIIRDTILGEHKEEVDRAGRAFKENGMRVYDLEVLDIEIQDDTISSLLEDSQHEAVQQRLKVEQKQRELETTEQTEKISQKIDIAMAETQEKRRKLEIRASTTQLEAELADLKVETEVEIKRSQDESSLRDIENEIERKKLEISGEKETQLLEFANQKLEQTIKELEANTDAVAKKAEAISPDLMAVLENFANKELAGKLAENLNVLSILGGGKKSVVEIASDLLSGTGVGEILKNIKLHTHIGNPVKSLLDKVGGTDDDDEDFPGDSEE